MQDVLGFLPSPLVAASHSLLQSPPLTLTQPFGLHSQLSFFSFYTVSQSRLIPTQGFMLCIDYSQIHYLEWLLFWSPDSCNCLQDMSTLNMSEHKYTIIILPKLLLWHYSLCPHHPSVIQARNLSHPLLLHIHLIFKLALHVRQGPLWSGTLCLPSTISPLSILNLSSNHIELLVVPPILYALSHF